MTHHPDPGRFDARLPDRTTPALVIGAGVAGLTTALRLAEDTEVIVVTAAPLGLEAATDWAQGGIAAAMDADDSPQAHALDTVNAGAGLTEPAIALLVATHVPSAVRWLAGLGVPFDRDATGGFALGLEAAHSARRIVKAGGDGTGHAVLSTLVEAARANRRITILERVVATALLTDDGGRVAGALCQAIGGDSLVIGAGAVVLATGGLGALYAETTNPAGATGSGLALAGRAGARLRDMEFVQFHPTAIDIAAAPGTPLPLATEALRGEGAILRNGRGDRFMADVPGRELAPRDVVARAIFVQRARGETVVLDATHLAATMETKFPTVTALCRANGIDPARQPIPVCPAAHYHMGGIAVDDRGRASIAGLYAAGECASSGLHGANRLASNSLAEALVFGERIAADILAADRPCEGAVLRLAGPPLRSPKLADVGAALALVRGIMARHVGVSRDAEGLDAAVLALSALAAKGFATAEIGLVIAVTARARLESRGGHDRSDHREQRAPVHSETTLDAVLDPGPAGAALRDMGLPDGVVADTIAFHRRPAAAELSSNPSHTAPPMAAVPA
ncbi:L-aspartate oxidase [Fulvimarina sp. 2208YS6-2-32]|uniref:L-aspartate oxidase n=1 Tax=Fulvimarina uroteuthidis TaxID=3098149 RepID=A0ABU5HZX5_9HYPH|nr:L-aspartate oxidase [Fulvimarina sp. 2208YS6-2-32]MDY8108692.1 L-aspartate oxidase [Fulvimarina sp. 2208YS6-2-32]